MVERDLVWVLKVLGLVIKRLAVSNPNPHFLQIKKLIAAHCVLSIYLVSVPFIYHHLYSTGIVGVCFPLRFIDVIET